jgi:hypothetical protein
LAGKEVLAVRINPKNPSFGRNEQSNHPKPASELLPGVLWGFIGEVSRLVWAPGLEMALSWHKQVLLWLL